MRTGFTKLFIAAIALFLMIMIYKGTALASNLPPVPVISGPLTVNVNTPYQFSGLLSYDPDGTIVEYSWFSSGATPLTSTNAVQTFSWALAGTRTIYLWVTDNGGLTRQTYLTLQIVDQKPPMTGITHYSSTIEFKVGATCQVGILNYPAGSSFSFFNDGGIGEVSIIPSGNTATLIGTKAGDKRLGYIVSHPDHASYRGYIDLVISEDDKNNMSGIYWYSPTARFTTGEDADIYIMGAPSGSSYSFSMAGSSAAYIKSTSGNMARIGITSAGEIRLNYQISCPGYHTYYATVIANAYEKEKPTAHITSVSNGYTGEWYTFSAVNSTPGVDAYEWKWHNPDSGTTVSVDQSFDKFWYANQFGNYYLYLRVRKDSAWSEWTSKLVQIVQGISFDADDVYSGVHTITDAEWQYIKQKTGTLYEKSYDFNLKTYFLNVEIYQDKNLLVYGDHTLDGIEFNPFKSGSEGIPYFRRNGVEGEYQYLGYIYGTNTPFSNQNYTAAHSLILQGVNKNAGLVALSSVPYSFRQSWGLTDADNSEFMALISQINSSASYGFSNNNAANSPSPLIISNVFSYDSIPYDPYSYGIINFFDKYIGGSIRLFFRYYNAGGYDWRTFEGVFDTPVQCPQISIADNIQKLHKTQAGINELRINGEISLTVYDDKKDNSLINRTAFFYDRDDVYTADLELFNNDAVTSITVSDYIGQPVYHDNHFVLRKNVEIVIAESMLHNGINEFLFEATGGISFSQEAKRSGMYSFHIRIEHDTHQMPVVETLMPSYTASTEASLRYRIHDTGTPHANDSGIYISSDGVSYVYISGGYPQEGSFDILVSGLLPDHLYWYKAYIRQGEDVFFGIERTFVTPKLTRPAPSKPVVTEITYDSARITSDAGSIVVCNGEEKPSGSVFYGLLEDTGYETYAYFAQDAIYEQSTNSPSTFFRTLIIPYVLEDRYIYVGDTVSIDDCDMLILIGGSSYIDISGRQITGENEGIARVRGLLGAKEAEFDVHVFSLPEEENMIIDIRIEKIYDPDFIDFGSFSFWELPVFEHPDGAMIDLGYLVRGSVEFSKDEMPEIPNIRLFDQQGVEYLAYRIQNGVYTQIPAGIQNTSYQDTKLYFDLYLRPDLVFFKKGEVINISSQQTVRELVVCLEFETLIDIEDDHPVQRIITKKIGSDLVQMFWYNLRRTCYDDIGYDKGW